MATLMTLRADLRLDLNDPTGAQARFADADLDRAIARALTEFSRALPYVQEATLRTVAGSRRVDLSGLTGLWDVEAVEWPTGAYPHRWRRFELAPDKQSMTMLVTRTAVGRRGCLGAVGQGPRARRSRWRHAHNRAGGVSTSYC